MIEPLSLTIVGTASDALKNYNFAADGRTVTFVASMQNITAPSLVIDDEIVPDNEATVNSDIVTSEVENESEALAREAETGKTPNTDKMDLQSTDGISSTLENSELDDSFSHTTDSSMAESRPDENVSLMAA